MAVTNLGNVRGGEKAKASSVVPCRPRVWSA